MVFNQSIIENNMKTKFVESYFFTCLDEGSIPSDSTKKTLLHQKCISSFCLTNTCYFNNIKIIQLKQLFK